MSGSIELAHIKLHNDGEHVNLPENKKQSSAFYNNSAFESSADYNGDENASRTILVVPMTNVKSMNNNVGGASEEEVEEEDGVVARTQRELSICWANHGKTVSWTIKALCLAAYGAYIAYAMSYEFGSPDSIQLLGFTLFGVFLCAVVLVRDIYGDEIYNGCLMPVTNFIKRHYRVFLILSLTVLLGLLLAFFISVALKNPNNLISLSGYCVYIVILFLFSQAPSKIRWRTVVWGLALQFVFAMFVLQTEFGYNMFVWLGDMVQEYLEYTDAGSIFVFGEAYEEHYFAMKVLPVVVFFSATISVLYYLGWMQAVILKIAWLMQRTMGTTGPESVNAAGNIFIGQTESPLLIKPFINDMTSSELHAVMTGGYATVAGSVMATYILFGVPANHLITASVMAAPCGLAISKISCPETTKSRSAGQGILTSMEKSPYRNGIEAAAGGASESIPLVANIAVNLIAFIAFLEFFNTTLTWMGHRVGLWPPEYEELTFQLICSYILWPFAFLMGVPSQDCGTVAELIGTKIILNEFVAYTELGVLIENSNIFKTYNGTCTYVHSDIYLKDTNQTLVGGVLTDRSIVISTYALCGFANLSSVGMVIGAMSALAPNRRPDIAALAFRAMLVGCVVSFMNACVANLFYKGTDTGPLVTCGYA